MTWRMLNGNKICETRAMVVVMTTMSCISTSIVNCSLQSSLAINPAALLPSSKRPKQDQVESVVPSFDEEPETRTLQSVAKVTKGLFSSVAGTNIFFYV
jgi:WASH complex subunit CAP-Z interacting, central region